jgi:dienelactone hydrolase
MQSDRIVELNIDNLVIEAVIRKPARVCLKPAVVIAMAGAAGIGVPCLVSQIFLAAGHYVAAFDMPFHGARGGQMPGLEAMARAVSAGTDVYREIRETGRALIDTIVEDELVEDGAIVLHGNSRGGHAALHIMAGDERVLATAISAPVTHLPAVEEFSELAESVIIQGANANALIPSLADRPVFIAIGNTDPRIGEDRCLDFHARLAAASSHTPPFLFCAPGNSHGDDGRFPADTGYQAAAGWLLQLVAQKVKG